MKHGVRGLCLDTRGVSQRKQMNKSADGEVTSISGNTSNTLYGWVGAQAREVSGVGGGGGGGHPVKALTKFKMTAYISMDF